MTEWTQRPIVALIFKPHSGGHLMEEKNRAKYSKHFSVRVHTQPTEKEKWKFESLQKYITN